MISGRILHFASRNVFQNLAAEERLFQHSAGRLLLFYVNRPCVVIGRTQNPFHEADVTYADNNNIPVVRRRSGGGTVVHDDGNLNICFIDARSQHDPCVNAKLLAGALRDAFGVPANVNQRGDILVDGKKVSGSAYRLTRDRAYHHATLLVNSDLAALRRVLASPVRGKMKAMGTQSVRVPVANVAQAAQSDISLEQVVQAVADRWQGVTGSATVEAISTHAIDKIVGGIDDERAELCDWKWIYGQTPKCSYQVDDDGDKSMPATGIGMNVTMHMRKGMLVERVEAVANEKAREMVAKRTETALNEALEGVPFDGQAMESALRTRASGPDPAVESVLRRVLLEMAWIPRRPTSLDSMANTDNVVGSS